MQVLGILICSIFSWTSSSAITYNLSGGRFGDNLLAYLHAKWLSYRTGLPLIYRSFPYSDQLVLSQFETRFYTRFQHLVHLGEEDDARIEKGVESTLFCVDYFGEHSWGKPGHPKFYIDWDDPVFRTMIQAMIVPRSPLRYTVAPPKDRTSVALHIRTGRGYEDFLTKNWNEWTIKLPRLPFFIRQLRYLYNFLSKRPLYVYIFTDDVHPDLVMKPFQEEFEGCDILFDCGARALRKDHQVLEDFFSMMRFDCAIHGESNFAVCAGLIKDYDVEIRPTGCVCKEEEGELFYEVMMRVHFDKTKRPEYQLIECLID